MNLSVNNAFNVAGFRSKKREKILAVAHSRVGDPDLQRMELPRSLACLQEAHRSRSCVVDVVLVSKSQRGRKKLAWPTAKGDTSPERSPGECFTALQS